MKDLEYLRLLAERFPTRSSVGAEIINLKAIMELPKGTEYFFSDIHGEYESFHYLMRSASGVIRVKINETFGDAMSDEDQLWLANLIYFPKRILSSDAFRKTDTPAREKELISNLVAVASLAGAKYTRSKVRKKLPKDYAYAIDELLHVSPDDRDKRMYLQGILNAIVSVGEGPAFITALCELIADMLIDQLHIIGDIFDRGPRPDKVMEELMHFHDVDIQWGNHDVEWMGAALGNPACIASVLRIATSYNCFDVLEDGYGINMRPLSMYAQEVYRDDPCECFMPHLLDENVSDSVSPQLAARMCKAITIILFKVEGQLIRRHPEYHMDHRLLLDKIDYDNGTVVIDGKTYPMKDTHFPSVDPGDPYTLTEKEQGLMDTLIYSFRHSHLLQKHIRFLYTNGEMYTIRNNNLLFHGCVPLNEDGTFMSVQGKIGRDMMDMFNQKAVDAYTMNPKDKAGKLKATDLFYYLWCGAKSPLFGKDKMSTFEHCFIEAPETKVETYNAYYRLTKEEKHARRILHAFGVSENGHIINGHVPVKAVDGESPVKANGHLFVIDGGLSKAYHQTTGIAGYTLISNSHHIALAEHKPFHRDQENTPNMHIVEVKPHRIQVKETDIGKELQRQIDGLQDLLVAYDTGLIRASDD